MKCSYQVHIYFAACRKSLLNIPTLPDYVACHVDETCSRIVCCIDVEVIGLSLKFDLDIDLCGNSIIASFESAQQKVDNALSKYEWGKYSFKSGYV